MARLIPVICLCLIGSGFAEKIYIPQVVTGPEWETTITILNLDDNNRTIDGEFFRSDGTPWHDLDLGFFVGGNSETNAEGEFEFDVGALSATSWTAFPRDEQAHTGYLVIDANPALTKVSAFLSYRREREEVTARVGLLSGQLATRTTTPMSANTAIAVINPTDEDALISFQVILDDGLGAPEEDIFAVLFEPHSQVAFFPAQLTFRDNDVFPFYVGQLNIWTQNGSSQFIALALRFPADGVFSSIPVNVIESEEFTESVPSLVAQSIPNAAQVPVFLGQGGQRIFRASVSEDSENLVAVFTPDSSGIHVLEVDYAEFPRSSICTKNGTFGDTLTCTIFNPAAGDWFISVRTLNVPGGGLLEVNF